MHTGLLDGVIQDQLRLSIVLAAHEDDVAEVIPVIVRDDSEEHLLHLAALCLFVGPTSSSNAGVCAVCVGHGCRSRVPTTNQNGLSFFGPQQQSRLEHAHVVLHLHEQILHPHHTRVTYSEPNTLVIRVTTESASTD